MTYAICRSPDRLHPAGEPDRRLPDGTAWDDTTMPLDTDLYYVVRAEDGGAAGDGP